MMIISPSILLSNGETYYPTGDEYLFAFAIAGCQWAIDALEMKKRIIENQWINWMIDSGCD